MVNEERKSIWDDPGAEKAARAKHSDAENEVIDKWALELFRNRKWGCDEEALDNIRDVIGGAIIEARRSRTKNASITSKIYNEAVQIAQEVGAGYIPCGTDLSHQIGVACTGIERVLEFYKDQEVPPNHSNDRAARMTETDTNILNAFSADLERMVNNITSGKKPHFSAPLFVEYITPWIESLRGFAKKYAAPKDQEDPPSVEPIYPSNDRAAARELIGRLALIEACGKAREMKLPEPMTRESLDAAFNAERNAPRVFKEQENTVMAFFAAMRATTEANATNNVEYPARDLLSATEPIMVAHQHGVVSEDGYTTINANTRVAIVAARERLEASLADAPAPAKSNSA